MSFLLNNRSAQVVSVMLIVMCAIFYAGAVHEFVPPNTILTDVPAQIGAWRQVQESKMDAAVEAVLKADDSLNRIYADGSASANLFIAFFRTQRAGVSPHSPKVCLPGAGWMPLQSDILTVPFNDGRNLEATRYIISRGDSKSLVVYWFETPHRSISNEYLARLYLIVDGLRYRRSDTAMIRVIVPIQGDDSAGATRTAIQFIQSLYHPVKVVLPA